MAMLSTSMTETLAMMVIALASSCLVMMRWLLLLTADPVYSVSLSVSNLEKSLPYWNQVLGMKIYSQSDSRATLGYENNQVFTDILCTTST